MGCGWLFVVQYSRIKSNEIEGQSIQVSCTVVHWCCSSSTEVMVR